MKIGADPELFLRDASGGLISAIGKIGGSKWMPLPMPIGDGFAMQEDNVALEYNIPPADTKEDLVSNIDKAMSFLSSHIKNMGLEFSMSSAEYFPKEQLLDPQALEFGCDPDFNAWEKGKINPRPCATDATLRSCGGHVHIGATIKNKLKFVRTLDLFLAVPSVLMDNGTLRKQLYGKPGAFRPKPYGLEYRVLSNFWIFKPQLVEWVWNNVALALESKIPVDQDKVAIMDAINNNNAGAANYLIQKYNIPVVYA